MKGPADPDSKLFSLLNKMVLLMKLNLLGVTAPHLISTTLCSRVLDRMEGRPPRLPKL